MNRFFLSLLLTLIATSVHAQEARYLTQYDGTTRGDLLSTFVRAETTVDDVGAPIGNNVRRFSAQTYGTASFVNYIPTGYDLGTAADLFAGGYDLNGDALLVVNDAAAGDVDILRINPDRTASLIKSTAVTTLPGAGGGITYAPRSAKVVFGTVILFAQRTNTGVIEGITAFYTQDNGTTWTVVPNSAADGGGSSGFPKPSAYGSNADSIPRGREWMSSVFPVGGVDANGRFNPNDFFVTWTDYLHAGSPSPKGFQCGAFRITRPSNNVDFTVSPDRVFYQRWEASAVNNLHGHSLALTGGGIFVFANGDVEGQHALHTITVDLDDYQAGTITVGTDWLGQLNAGASNGKGCPQISMMYPGRNGDIYGSNDTWPSPILKISNVSSASETCVLHGAVYIEADTFTGGFKAGWDNIWTDWNPEPDGSSSRVTVGGFGSSNVMRHYSPDNQHYVMLNNSDGNTGPQVIVGDFLAIVRSSDEMLMLADIPNVKLHRPLKLAPGADNYLTSATPDNGGSATTGNTRSLVVRTNGEYRYATGGALVANAPKVAPPLNDPIYLLLDPGAGSAANYQFGSQYLQASGQTINIGSGLVGGTMYVALCSNNAIGRFSGRVGVAGATNDSTAEIGIKPDANKDQWFPFSLFGDPANNPAAARGLLTLYGGTTFSTVNQSCPVLVAFGGLYVNQSITPWPTARLTTSNDNEIAYETFPTTGVSNWTVSTILYRSQEQATIGTAPPAGTLWTIKKDSDDYVTIYFDGPNFELEITVTEGGIADDTEVIAMEDWPRTSGLPIVISDNGTDILVSVLTLRNGIQTATCDAATLGGQPTLNQWCNHNQTSVYNFYTAGCEYRPYALTFQQQEGMLKTLDFISTDNQLVAQAVADEVKLQLTDYFSDIPANVWLQDMAQVQKTGSTGEAQSVTNVKAVAIDGYLDTEIAAMKAKTDLLPAIATGTPGGLPVLDANSNIPANLRRVNNYDEIDGFNTAQALAVILANAAGEIQDSEDDTPKLKSLDGNVDRISAEVDPYGNRTITIDVSDLP